MEVRCVEIISIEKYINVIILSGNLTNKIAHFIIGQNLQI
jgi:hypothetical protein